MFSFKRYPTSAGLVLGILISCFSAGQANAQTIIQDATRASESIQRQQLQRQEEDIRRSLENNRPQTNIEVPEPVIPKGKGSGCKEIVDIRILDADNLPAEEAEKIVAPYEGTCMGVDDIQSLLSDITKFYIDNGYVATRAYLPPQDLSTRLLDIQVVEGRIGKVTLGEGSEGTARLENAFPTEPGTYLNLRDFEQGLDQINRLLSNNATLELLPGEKPGESLVVIHNTPGKRWHVNATADNYGTRNTGREQVGITLSYDNPLGFNDYVSITERHSDWPFTGSNEQSSSTTGVYSIPFGYTTLTAGYTYSHYDSILTTAGGVDLELSGNSEAAFASLDHVFYRDQDSKFSGYTTLTRKTNTNFIENAKLDVSSRTLTVLDLGVNYSTIALGGSVSLSGGYSRGLDLFGVEKDPAGLPGSLPRAEFSKLTVSAGYYKPFNLFEENMLYSTQFSGQYALDTLFGSEQFSAGGIYTVRGFYEEVLANDHGAYLRNDLAVMLPVDSLFGHAATVKPYIGLDAGAVHGRAPGTPTGVLIGAALGVSIFSGPISFDIFTGYPLSMPDEVDNEHFNTFARLSVNF